MNLYFRLLWLLVRRWKEFFSDIAGVFFESGAKNAKRAQVNERMFETCSTKFRVNPLDLDINLHMNNGRYLSLMDLGRLDLLMKAHVFWKLVLSGYYPVVASETIRFFRSLGPMQKFELTSELIFWNEKDFYVEQKFISNHHVCAIGMIRGRFRKRGPNPTVPTSQLFQFLRIANPPSRQSLVPDQMSGMDLELYRRANSGRDKETSPSN